jgi:alpha,alpha-trehalase
LLATNSASALQAHITSLWPLLTREPDTISEAGSLLDLPAPYVVPGGRFRELYYWDSYFTLLGLRADGQTKLVDSMVDNFVSLLERFGHVPNGTRSYYLSRSQPPVLYLMVELAAAQDRDTQRRRLYALRAEYAFWMSGERVVAMPDGTPLNRYWDARNTPREESFREDTLLAKGTQRPAGTLWRDVRAAAESGWDFSSRWFADGKTLASIDTTNVVPVDLNALLYGLERSIAAQCRVARNHACTARFDTLAERRRSAVERFLWDPVTGHYTDWDIALARPRPGLTAVALFPLFTGLASRDHAQAMARLTERQLLAPGGLRTTLSKTGQQWDAPNGWAPLQWVAFDGLRRYGEDALARLLAERFLANVQREFNATGKLVEKYNVETPGSGGGGEYPLQDGFGWTNGVVRALTNAIGTADTTETKP